MRYLYIIGTVVAVLALVALAVRGANLSSTLSGLRQTVEKFQSDVTAVRADVVDQLGKARQEFAEAKKGTIDEVAKAKAELTGEVKKATEESKAQVEAVSLELKKKFETTEQELTTVKKELAATKQKLAHVEHLTKDLAHGTFHAAYPAEEAGKHYQTFLKNPKRAEVKEAVRHTVDASVRALAQAKFDP